MYVPSTDVKCSQAGDLLPLFTISQSPAVIYRKKFSESFSKVADNDWSMICLYRILASTANTVHGSFIGMEIQQNRSVIYVIRSIG